VNRSAPIAVAWRLVPALTWMVVIFLLSSREGFPQPPGFSAATLSVAAHLILFGILGLLILFALCGQGPVTLRAVVIAVALTTLYGVFDEIHQAFVPGRQPSIFDIVVDMLGAMLAATLAFSYARWRERAPSI
jgi:VanZ family protein